LVEINNKGYVIFLEIKSATEWNDIPKQEKTNIRKLIKSSIKQGIDIKNE